MPNYFIIGGDGKEYGPATEADVRQWIADGRLNRQSLAKAESDAEFRVVAQFPEFTAALNEKTAPPQDDLATAANSTRNAAIRAIRVPAVSLKITAGINFILSLWSLVRLTFFRQAIEQEIAKYPQLQDPAIQKWIQLIYGPLGIGNDIFAMLMAALIFFGASQMQKLKSYEMSFVAALLAMLPCVSACCLLGLPFGVWALVVLNKTEIKAQFK